MTAKQLAQLKAKQEEEQEEALDEVINTVRNIKGGNVAIKDQLKDQDGMLNVTLISIFRNWMKGLMRIPKIWVKLKEK